MGMSKGRNIQLEGNYYNAARTNSTNVNGANSRKLSGATLTGIIVGSVLILIFALFLVICLIAKCRKRRKKKQSIIKRKRVQTKENLLDKEKVISEDGKMTDPKVIEQVVTSETNTTNDGDRSGNENRTGQTGIERKDEGQNEKIFAAQELSNHSSTNKEPTALGSTKNLTSRPIKSSRVSPSQLYAPNSDQSKPTGQAKSPFSVLSSEGPPIVPEQTISNISTNNNAETSNTVSRNKIVKVSKPVTLNKGATGTSDPKESLQNSTKQNVITQKPTLGNDDGNDDDDKMKRREESLTNVVAPTATLTTEKMKEMMKQMNLEVGSSNSTISDGEKGSGKKNEEGLGNIKGGNRKKEVGRGRRSKDRKYGSKKRGKKDKESVGKKV